MKQITFKQYRSIDLVMLCVLTAVFEGIVTFAPSEWFALQAMSVSITLAMTCIAMLRWNTFAVLPAIVGSLAFCVSSNATLQQYLIYCVGNIACLIAVPIVQRIDKEKIRLRFLRRTSFAIIVYLCMALGKWIVSLLFEITISSLIAFVATDILSLLFAVLVLYICKGLDGVIEDQKAYLIRLDEERKAEQEAFFGDQF